MLNDGGADTTTASSEMVFNIFATLVQLEHMLVRERTQAGLTKKRTGHTLGYSFGTHLLENEHDIRTIHKMLGRRHPNTDDLHSCSQSEHLGCSQSGR